MAHFEAVPPICSSPWPHLHTSCQCAPISTIRRVGRTARHPPTIIFHPPRWGKGTLFGPHFHGFDLILKSISVIYLVGLTSPCRRQRLRRVGFKYPHFSSNARSRRSWIGFVATRSRLRVRVPRWSSYILLHVSCAVGLRATWFDPRLGSRGVFLRIGA